jgi:hypothetical protein
MATIILSAIGNAFGGPIGGAIGGAIGQQVDNRLFAPKARQGPRLNELAVQTSSYGSPIPRLFGKTRTSGTVIWATDLIESKRKISTGKGRPKQTVYSYSANFAVALSARPILSIGRIWADGKLLRGTAGDFKSATTMRVHTGLADQVADPLIAASEGTSGCPAYRGLSYVVFEDFELADYGNRIPSLSFEVIADPDTVPINRIIADLVPGSVADVAGTVDGFVATGNSARAILQSIADVIPFMVQDDEPLGFRSAALASIQIQADELGLYENGSAPERFSLTRSPLVDLPGQTSLSYYDSDRDYLEGAQTALRRDLGNTTRPLELAATLKAGQARNLVERQAQLAVTRRTSATITLPWRWLSLSPGQSVKLPNALGDWVISNWRWEAMRLMLDLVKPEQADSVDHPAEPGRAGDQPDILFGQTRIALLDLPWLGGGLATQSTIYVAAAGTQAGWRSAALLQSIDGGTSFEEIGSTATPAIMGESLNALSPFNGHGFDERSFLDVRCLNSGMVLNSTNKEGLIGGQNIAIVGEELIQFERAEQRASLDWRLSGLLRARRGTEWAASGHGAGERFILLSADSLYPLDRAGEGSSMTIAALGQGDVQTQLASITDQRFALLAPSPVHLKAMAVGNDIVFTWVRRGRLGWAWLDGVDAPLAEETEHYAVTLILSNGQLRHIGSSLPAWTYDAAAKAADGAAGATSFTIEVRQQGTHGLSKPATLSLPL